MDTVFHVLFRVTARRVCAALVAAACVALVPSAARAETVTVDPSQGWDGIQNAIKDAPNGAVIVINAGTYEAPKGLMIEGKTLTLRGKGKVFIVCTSMDENVIWMGNSPGSRLENLRMTHRKPYADVSCLGNVVYIWESPNVRIVNCEINGCGTVGVHAYRCDNLDVTGCNLHHNTRLAVALWESKGVTVSGCRIEDNGGLFRKESNSTLSLRGNSLARNIDYSSTVDMQADGKAVSGKTARFSLVYQGVGEDGRHEFRDEEGMLIRLRFIGERKSDATKLMPEGRYTVTFTIEGPVEHLEGAEFLKGRITSLEKGQ